MNRYMVVGLSVLAGAALLEAALIPGVVIGGAAVLVPQYLPKLRRRLRLILEPTAGRRDEAAAPPADRSDVKALPDLPAGFTISRAVAKTVTFRVIVTSLDFTTNYVVIGELATAAGLSTFSLVVGPMFYFAHEMAWNWLGPTGAAVDLQALAPSRREVEAEAPAPDHGGFAISKPLAKTITFRTFATVMDFTTNYVVIGDAATAVVLSAFGFFVGPFVYFGHEKVWDYYWPEERPPAPSKPTTAGPIMLPHTHEIPA
jgi:uncharacterized membrane protein